MSDLDHSTMAAGSLRHIWLALVVLGLMALTAGLTWMIAGARIGESAAAARPATLVDCEAAGDRQPGALYRCIVTPANGKTVEI